MGPQYRPYFISPLWHLEFRDGSYISANFVGPWYILYKASYYNAACPKIQYRNLQFIQYYSIITFQILLLITFNLITCVILHLKLYLYLTHNIY